jgi:hypothetical protein
MNALVRFALAEQPLPRTTLALEQSEVGINAAPAGLSPMLAGWSVSDLGAEWSDNLVTTVPEGRAVEGELDTPHTLGTKNAATDREGVVAGTGSSARTETMLAINGGLLENVDFDEPLSQ